MNFEQAAYTGIAVWAGFLGLLSSMGFGVLAWYEIGKRRDQAISR